MARPVFVQLLLHDIPLQVITVSYVGVTVLDLAPGRSPLEGAPAAARAALLLAVAVAALHSRQGMPKTSAGKRFWRGITAALVAFFAARIVELLFVAGTAAGLAAGGLDALAWVFLVLASALRPDLASLEPDKPEKRLAARLSFASAAAFIAALYLELTVIPAVLDPSAPALVRGPAILDLCVGVFLLARFAYLDRTAASTRWRLVYRSLFAAAAIVLVVAAFELRGASVPGIVTFLPALPILVAARASRHMRHLPITSDASRRNLPRTWEPLALYALVLPFLHVTFDLTGQVSPDTRTAQGSLVLVYCGCVGTLALVQNARRERRRRTTEGNLRDSELRYRHLIESYPDAILIEQTGKLVYINTTGMKKLGLERSGEGHSFDSLGFPSRPLVEERTQIPLDCRVTGAGGEEIDLEVSYYDIAYLGRPACQAIARDVTEARRLRAHSEKTERLAWLGQFSAALAHEIRNPLAAIVMHCFFLAERLSKDDDENLRTLADINTAVERMQKLVNGLLSFVRPPRLQLMREDLLAVLDSARLELTRRADPVAVDILEDYRHDRSTVRVDVNQMVAAFTHILDNAVRAMPDGGTLTLKTASPSDEKIEVVIEDTGGGISAEDLERVFEPFYTRRDDGVGLGLAHVARIFDQHDCSYRVESESGTGTRFIVDIPLTEGEPSQVLQVDRLDVGSL